MKEFTTKPIVVPWDFSQMSRNALTKAVELASSLDQIEVVHVTPYPTSVEPSIMWGNFSDKDVSEELRKVFFDEVSEEQFANLKFTTLFGEPGSKIAKLAEDRAAGLVVISSHGRTGLSRMLLGSVAERVVRLSPCPVLVLRG